MLKALRTQDNSWKRKISIREGYVEGKDRVPEWD